MLNKQVILLATLFVAFNLSSHQAEAGTMILDFEGVGDLNSVGNYYQDAYGITFSSNAIALVDSDAGGSGNFGSEPSPDTILIFLEGESAVMNVANGFTKGFSFFYSAVIEPGMINVWDGLNGTGNLLTTLILPLTPHNGAPDPTGDYSPFIPFGVSFEGVAKSVDFGGTASYIGFDNITLGSKTPGKTVPESTSGLTLIGLGILGASVTLKCKK